MPQSVEIRTIEFEMSEEGIVWIDSIAATCGLESRAECLKVALGFFHWAVCQRMAGKHIGCLGGSVASWRLDREGNTIDRTFPPSFEDLRI